MAVSTGTTAFSDYSNPYLSEMYNQQKQTAANALTSAYKSNMADYDTQEKDTQSSYYKQRASTQGAYEQALKNAAEYNTAAGLNSGAQAQSRIAYNAANQTNLSNLSQAEQSALNTIAQNRAATQREYQANLAQNESDYNSKYTEALYNAWRDQVSDEQAAISQQNTERSYYYQLAMASIQAGITPSSAVLDKAGIDSTTARSLASYYSAKNSSSSSSGGGSNKSTDTGDDDDGDDNVSLVTAKKDSGFASNVAASKAASSSSSTLSKDQMAYALQNKGLSAVSNKISVHSTTPTK